MLEIIREKAKADALLAFALIKELGEIIGEPEKDYFLRKCNDSMYVQFMEQGKAEQYTREYQLEYSRVFVETWDEQRRKARAS